MSNALSTPHSKGRIPLSKANPPPHRHLHLQAFALTQHLYHAAYVLYGAAISNFGASYNESNQLRLFTVIQIPLRSTRSTWEHFSRNTVLYGGPSLIKENTSFIVIIFKWQCNQVAHSIRKKRYITVLFDQAYRTLQVYAGMHVYG